MEENQYLDCIQNILKYGNKRLDRTGIGTLSLFGMNMRWNLRNNTFPLLTTKKMFWRGIVEELLWFISGSTNSKELEKKGITIWKDHSSREYLDSLGFYDREEGDLGPVYGFQWRHYGEKYIDMNIRYQGLDQLLNVIEKIKTNPNDRRIVLCAWNPLDIDKMALPPCHCLVQFYVANNELYSQMYQRSADIGLGVPFNIASYSLLTCIIAHLTNLKPAEFIHVMGDVHIYLNQVDQLKQQIQRKPFEFPKLEIITKKENLEDFKFEDFKLLNYKHHGKINMDMAV